MKSFNTWMNEISATPSTPNSQSGQVQGNPAPGQVQTNQAQQPVQEIDAKIGLDEQKKMFTIRTMVNGKLTKIELGLFPQQIMQLRTQLMIKDKGIPPNPNQLPTNTQPQ